MQDRRGVTLAPVRPPLEERLELLFECLDEPARELISVGRQRDHRRPPVAFVAASLDPASLNRALYEVGHIRPVAAQGVSEAAHGGGLHRRAEKLGLGGGQTVRATGPQIRVLQGHSQVTESAGHRVGRLVHAAMVALLGDALTYSRYSLPLIRESVTYWKEQPMTASSVFTTAELDYLHGGRRLGRIATVGKDGTPHVVPSGWVHNPELDTIDVTGHDVDQTKKFRDVARSGRAAIVIDDLASVNPWRPRAIEVRGRAEAVLEPEALIRIHPERIVSWGVDDRRLARTVRPGDAVRR